MSSNNLSRMIILCTKLFDGVDDKGGNPYILHCLAVMNALSIHRDIELMQIGCGHDLIEDCFRRDIVKGAAFLRQEGFSERVIYGIVGMTKLKGESHLDYRAKIRSEADLILCKREDLIHNMDISRLGNLPQGEVEKAIIRNANYKDFLDELDAEASKQNLLL